MKPSAWMQILMMPLLAMMLIACTDQFGAKPFGETSDVAEVSLELPSLASMMSASVSSANYKASSSPLIQYNASATVSDEYGLATPSSLTEITCFALAVEWPEAAGKGNACGGNGDGPKILPGLFQGLFAPGDAVALLVPAGKERKIYLLGFAAADPALCVDFFKNNGPPKAMLSAPLVIGELKADLTAGKQKLTISPDIAKAAPLEGCDGPLFAPQVDPVTIARPTITIVSPSSGLVAGGDLISIYGTGFKAGAQVTIGSNVCSSVNVISATQITCVTAYSTLAGFQKIVVTNPDGSLTGTNFEYRAAAVAVSDASVSEGGTLQFTLSLTQTLNKSVDVTFATVDGTGLANLHYKPKAGVATIPAGSLSTIVTIETIDNDRDELDKTLLLKVLRTTNATIVDPVGTGTIGDNDEAAARREDSAFETHVIGIYESRSDHGYNYHPQGEVAVKVYPGQKPMILVLSSYEPQKWVLTGAVDQVRKVILNGYHDQTVTGIETSKVTEHSYLGTGKAYYSKFLYGFSPSTAQSAAFIDFVESDQGTPVVSAQGLYSGVAFGINGAAPATASPTPKPTATPVPAATPYVSIRASYGNEIIESTRQNYFHVSLDRPAVAPVTVSWRVVGVTAQYGTDFLGTTGSVTIDPGMLATQFTFPIVDDTAREPDETFRVEITSATGAAISQSSSALVTIVDNDYGSPTSSPTPTPAPVPTSTPMITISAGASLLVTEGQATSFKVSLDRVSLTPVTVQYAIVPETATLGLDLIDGGLRTLTFSPGTTEMGVSVVTIDDTLAEMQESFRVVLSAPTGGVLGFPDYARKTIVDNETAAGASPTPAPSPTASATPSSTQTYNRQKIYAYTGGEQSFTVPPGVDKLYFMVWGAGGGGSFSIDQKGWGGGGAGQKYLWPVTEGQTYMVIVGGGGRRGFGGQAGTRAFGGGGAAGPRSAGSGGGRSAIRFAGNEIVTAGGGGGAAEESDMGFGSGGNGECAMNPTGGFDGSSIKDTSWGTRGQGATKSMPGQGGSPYGFPGTLYQGGDGDTSFGFGNGGAGGGGYFGGGSGGGDEYGSQGGGGGGGSSFTAIGGSLASCSKGIGRNPGYAADTVLPQNAARGGISGQDGGHGFVVIKWYEP